MIIPNYRIASEMFFNPKATPFAVALVKKMAGGEYLKDFLANSFTNFTGELEHRDFISYCAYHRFAVAQLVKKATEE